MGWQNGVGAPPCVGSVQGTHSCVALQTSGLSALPPCLMISGIRLAVTQPPAPTIEVHFFSGWPPARRISSGTQTSAAFGQTVSIDARDTLSFA